RRRSARAAPSAPGHRFHRFRASTLSCCRDSQGAAGSGLIGTGIGEIKENVDTLPSMLLATRHFHEGSGAGSMASRDVSETAAVSAKGRVANALNEADGPSSPVVRFA